jgi:hypothetical protein
VWWYRWWCWWRLGKGCDKIFHPWGRVASSVWTLLPYDPIPAENLVDQWLHVAVFKDIYFVVL